MNTEQTSAFFNWALDEKTELVFKDYALLVAASAGFLELVDYFSQQNHSTVFGREYALIEAARKGHTLVVASLLQRCIYQVARDFALVEASGSDCLECVQYLTPYCSEKTHSVALCRSVQSQASSVIDYWLTRGTLDITPEDLSVLSGGECKRDSRSASICLE